MSSVFPHRFFRLESQNFTSPDRTPWGGEEISHLKKIPRQKIGESWEISTHPSLPSFMMWNDQKVLLSKLIAEFPEKILGKKLAAATKGKFPLPVKFLNAAPNHPLSFQVHPSDITARLGERGKEEAWYIMDAKPGAGIYLGFKEGLSRQEVAAALKNGKGGQAVHFVEVHPGETYRIKPHTPHAIGGGILLAEIQQSSATTFRYFDWNREPKRELHLERALEETNWNESYGKDFVSRLRRQAHFPPQPYFEMLLDADPFSIESLWLPQEGMSFEVSTEKTCVAVVALQGQVLLENNEETLTLDAGYSLLAPACIDSFQVTAFTAAQILLVRPKTCL